MSFSKKKTEPKEKIKWEISRNDRLKELLVYLVFLLILFLFFRSVFVLAVMPVVIFFYHRYNKKILIRKYKDKLNSQFKDALISLSSALRAGFSSENALVESYKEMVIVYGATAPICNEMKIMINQMSLGTPLESVFGQFAKRTEIEDIETFSSVFNIAKRSGGDLVEIIKKTADDIASKIDTRNEISVLISSKKLEQNIMSVMPLAIILYVQFTSKGMLDCLYGNLKGVLIMSACLAVYAAAYFLSRKIMDIEV